MKKLTTVAASVAIAASFATGNVMATGIMATENPFGIQQLDSGYNVAMSDGMCGGDDKSKDGKCGGDKGKEGKCGGDKGAEGKCGGDKAKEGEAKK